MPSRGFNARMLKRLLRDRPHKWGAEIGVFEGDTSGRLLAWMPGILLIICVDVWEHNQEFHDAMPKKRGRILNANWRKVRTVFKAQVLDPYPGRVWAIKNTSINASKIIDDNSLDWIFIDGNHAYEPFLKDIYAWWPKLRVGGLLCGDDYVDKPGYGVIQAVDKLFGNNARKIGGRIWYTEKREEAL